MLFVFGNHGSILFAEGASLLACVDRLNVTTVRRAAGVKLAQFPELLRLTPTFDNGKECAAHRQLAASTGIDIYFAKPDCAWQRGANENTSGLVRQSGAKGTDVHDVSHRAVADLESSMNDRPRERPAIEPHEKSFAPFALSSVSISNFEPAISLQASPISLRIPGRVVPGTVAASPQVRALGLTAASGIDSRYCSSA